MNNAYGFLALPCFAVGAVLALFIPLHERVEVETHYTEEVLTYTESSVLDRQVTKFCFPRICDKTEVEYGFQNTSRSPGVFEVHVHFFNETEEATESESSSVASGEDALVNVVSPLEGRSQYTVEVMPPVVKVPHQRNVTKQFNTFRVLYDLLPHRLNR